MLCGSFMLPIHLFIFLALYVLNESPSFVPQSVYIWAFCETIKVLPLALILLYLPSKLISAHYQILISLDHDPDTDKPLFSPDRMVHRIDLGYTIRLKGKRANRLRQVSDLILNRKKEYPWKPALGITPFKKGHYSTRFPHHILYYDPIRNEIHLQNLDDHRAAPRV